MSLVKGGPLKQKHNRWDCAENDWNKVELSTANTFHCISRTGKCLSQSSVKKKRKNKTIPMISHLVPMGALSSLPTSLFFFFVAVVGIKHINVGLLFKMTCIHPLHLLHTFRLVCVYNQVTYGSFMYWFLLDHRTSADTNLIALVWQLIAAGQFTSHVVKPALVHHRTRLF